MKGWDWKTTGQWVVIVGAAFAFWLSDHDKRVAMERDLLACQRLIGVLAEGISRVDVKVDNLSERITVLEHR